MVTKFKKGERPQTTADCENCGFNSLHDMSAFENKKDELGFQLTYYLRCCHCKKFKIEKGHFYPWRDHAVV